MKVLSLFDGISCARVSLDRANIPVSSYHSCEIDKNAIKVSQKNYPDIVQCGSVINYHHHEKPNLLIGGSPCTDLSIAKKDREGLEGSRSSLFWEFVRIKNETNPDFFILENVASMPKKDKDIITNALNVEPVLFNASLVSAQSRKRLFWTNITFELPDDKGIVLKDILQPPADVDDRFTIKNKTYTTTATSTDHSRLVKLGHVGNSDAQANRIYDTSGKSVTLSANGGGLGAKTGLIRVGREIIRKLTPIECERLQGLPDNYTDNIANTNRYKALGNAFNVDVVAHILKKMEWRN